jgi:branched-chain amino acid transport system substrate-binding protein
VVQSPEVQQYLSSLSASGQHYSLVAVQSDTSWGKASNDLVKAVYQEHVLALVSLDRSSSHLAEQIAVKTFVPVIAISDDRTLTSTNIPWIFRLPERTAADKALGTLLGAIAKAGPNRAAIRDVLASGQSIAGIQFDSSGERMK